MTSREALEELYKEREYLLDHKLVRLEHNILAQQEYELLKEVLEEG